jgi:hypothetical protein
MSRDVEVCQIISVHPEADEVVIPLRVRNRRGEVAERTIRSIAERMPAADTREWIGPPDSSPSIALEQVVLPEELDSSCSESLARSALAIIACCAIDF